jgi:hypothetical protein
MATGAVPTNPADPTPVNRKAGRETIVGYDRFIDDHLRKTRSQVKWVEISSAAMILVAATLGYLMVVVLLDHWLIPGGLGFWGRIVALALLVLGAGTYFATSLAPLLLRRVNPVYAAHAIEQARPTLKNSLVNFLLLRSSRAEISESVYQAVEQQAATRLSQVHIESAVDRSRLIRIFSILTAIVAISCLYLIASPKDPLSTVRRIALPWADIAAPTRVTIEEVSPGDTNTFYDGYVTVEAVVRGVDDADPVTLYYSTADGQTVGQSIPMQRPSGAYRHSATLPAGTGGLQQDVMYHIEAGDARSNLYQVEVRPAPTILIDRVEYHYPKYTGMEPATRKHGDLKAIEGTRITLHARANQDILAAWLDLDCKGKRNKPFKSSGREASIRIPLRMVDDRQTQEFSSYQIRFTNTERHENPQPIRHTVEVVPDQPPDVKFDAPTQPQVELAVNGRLEMKVRARDPDFALSRVEIIAERMDQSGDLLLAEPLLKQEQTEFEGTFTFDAARLKLKPGDTVRYWAQARDNRQPNDDQPADPNIAVTDKFKIVIVEPKPQPRENDLANNDQPRPNQPHEDQPRQGQPQQGQPQQGNQQAKQAEQQDQAGEGQQAEPMPPAEGPDGQKQDPADGSENKQQQPGNNDGQAGDAAGNKQSTQQGEKGESDHDRRIDPMSNPGDAFEEALKHRQQQEKENQGSSKQQSGEQTGEHNDQSKSDQNTQQKPGSDENNSAQKPGNQQQSDQQKPQQGEKPQSGNERSGESSNATSKPQDGSQGDKNQEGDGAKRQPENGQPSPMGDNARQQKPGTGNEGASQQDQSGESRDAQQGGKQGAGNDMPPRNVQGQGKGGHEPAGDKPQPGGPKDSTPSEKESSEGSGQPKQGEQAKSGENSAAESPEGTRNAQGQGSEQKGAARPDQKSPNQPGQNPDMQGGNRENEKGNQGGSGQKTQDQGPSPSPQKANQPGRAKEPSGEDQPGETPKGDEAKSPSQSKKQSDSKGGEAGDQSGGGKAGGGQAASGTEGTGAPGSTTAADQGNKKAPGAGQGETSEQAGAKAESDKPTGASDPSGKLGEGSQQKAGGDKNGGQPGGKQPQQGPSQQDKPNGQQPDNRGEQGDAQSNDGSKQQPGQRQPSGQGNSTGGGGQPGDSQGEPMAGERGQQPGEPGQQAMQQQAKPDEVGGDAANLDYARKATDLALEHLKDQLNKDQPDQELLDKLKWSREDLQRFVDHWERMKRDAQAPGEAGDAARRKLNESLGGLGLKPHGTRIKSNSGAGDQLRELRSSRRASPPPEYAEQVKAYKQRLAKGQQDQP